MKQAVFCTTSGNSSYACPLPSTWTFDFAENRSQLRLPIDVTISKLRMSQPVALGATESRTLAFRKTGSTQSLSVSVGAGDLTDEDLSNSVSYTAGDYCSILQTLVTVLNPGTANFTYELETTTANRSLYGWLGNRSGAFWSGGTPVYDGAFAGGIHQSAGANAGAPAWNVAGIAGDISMLAFNVTTAPGTGENWTALVVLNGVEQDGSGSTVDTRCVISNSNTYATASFTLPIALGDLVAIKVLGSAGAANTYLNGCTVFDADTDGSFMLCGSPRVAPTNGYFNLPVQTDTSWNATELNREYLEPDSDFRVSAMYLNLVNPPGTGNGHAYTLRVGGANTVLSVAATNSTTVVSDTGIVPLTDLWSVLGATTGTPGSMVYPRWAFAATELIPSYRNIVGGDTHSVVGDDNLVSGATNAITGNKSCAHGEGASVVGNRSVLFNLSATPHTLSADDTIAIWADGDVLVNGSKPATGPTSATDNAIARFDGTTGALLQNSTPIVQDDGRISSVTDPSGAQDAATKNYVDSVSAGGAPIGAQYVTIATNATLTNERVLTGTTNQITVTDNGAGSTVVLSAPQNLHTSATPQFARMGLGNAADANAALKMTGQYWSAEYDAGNSGTSKTINWNDGNTQILTLTGNCTLTLSNPQAGGRYLLILIQDGTGSRTVTWPSTVKWSNATAPTLTTAASSVDLVTLAYTSVSSGIYLSACNKDIR
jgi:hypothetical protein